ncbi:MAG: Two component transcriptional regulator, LuxR family [Frankiales bacterium]|jgi:CheY-like chemotaxis protein|nr:Two component transcriptional regulator, LuxR family [Frankiales bacterium]
MTSTADAEALNRAWTARTGPELVRDQLAGIGAWNASHRPLTLVEDDAAAAGRSREMRLDLARRMDVVRRQHEAIVARTGQHLAQSTRLVRDAAPARAVLAHRNAWFLEKVGAGLVAAGVDVVAQVENGADAVGVSVAEQPDLLLVEDKLPMINGAEVIRQVLQFAPRTLAVAHVSYEDAIAPLLEAGARTAFTRRVPPAEVARDLCLLVAPPSA